MSSVCRVTSDVVRCRNVLIKLCMHGLMHVQVVGTPEAIVHGGLVLKCYIIPYPLWEIFKSSIIIIYRAYSGGVSLLILLGYPHSTSS